MVIFGYVFVCCCWLILIYMSGKVLSEFFKKEGLTRSQTLKSGGFGEMSNIIKRIDDKMKILDIKSSDKLLYILQLAEEKLQDKIDEQKMVDDMHQEYLREHPEEVKNER